MKSRSFTFLVRSAALVAFATYGAGCAPSDDDVGVSNDELKLEGRDIATSRTELRAGQAFIPGLNEALLEVGEPCLPGSTVGISGGQVYSSAAVVQNKDSLSRELGFTATGTIPAGGGIAANASLTRTTTFDSQSAVVLFQSTGTYKSTLTKVEAELPTFSARDVSRCGYGYVTEANHRVTAALVVKVRSTNSGSSVRGEAGAGKTGVVEAKGTLSNIISKGNVEISVSFGTDVIPNLATAPIGDSVFVIGNEERDKEMALEKLNKALDWLGQAHSDIQSYLNALQTGAVDVPPAPTQSVRFRFYPSTPETVKRSLERATTSSIATYARVAETASLIDAWEHFAVDAKEGRGFAWNIPSAPVANVGELETKKVQLLEEGGGKLLKYRDDLDDLVERCTEALRNDAKASTAGALTSSLSGALDKACVAAPALPVDKKANDVRPIVTTLVTESKYNIAKCPGGSRRPLEAEAKVFGPWSRSIRSSEKGIWMQDSGCNFSHGWIFDGAPGCTPFASSKVGLTICVSSEKGPLPEL